MERLSRIIAELTKGDVQVIDRDSKSHRMTINDIMINAPYNAQVAALSRFLPDARVGTVDKFPGPGGAGGYFLHGHLITGRCASRNGIPV